MRRDECVQVTRTSGQLGVYLKVSSGHGAFPGQAVTSGYVREGLGVRTGEGK